MCFIMYGWQRATTTHARPHPLRYLLVSVSLGGKSISLRRYCENASCIGVHPSARPPPTPRLYKRTRRVFRTIGFFFCRFSLSLYLFLFPIFFDFFFFFRLTTTSHLDFNRKAGNLCYCATIAIVRALGFYYPRTR